jgi:hypothetical protein
MRQYKGLALLGITSLLFGASAKSHGADQQSINTPVFGFAGQILRQQDVGNSDHLVQEILKLDNKRYQMAKEIETGQDNSSAIQTKYDKEISILKKQRALFYDLRDKDAEIAHDIAQLIWQRYRTFEKYHEEKMRPMTGVLPQRESDGRLSPTRINMIRDDQWRIVQNRSIPPQLITHPLIDYFLSSRYSKYNG